FSWIIVRASIIYERIRNGTGCICITPNTIIITSIYNISPTCTRTAKHTYTVSWRWSSCGFSSIFYIPFIRFSFLPVVSLDISFILNIVFDPSFTTIIIRNTTISNTVTITTNISWVIITDNNNTDNNSTDNTDNNNTDNTDNIDSI